METTLEKRIIEKFGKEGDKKIRQIIADNTDHTYNGFEKGTMYRFLAERALKTGKITDWIS